MCKTSLVLTILGADRPGLVDSLAQTVTEHDGNWIESRMARLAGQFAGILRVEVDAAQAATLTAALDSLSAGGLDVTVHADTADVQAAEKPTVALSLVGQDRPGIVREITRVLANHRVNVEALETECPSAAHSGQTLFQATAQLRLPDDLAAETLRAALEQVANDMMVDIALE